MANAHAKRPSGLGRLTDHSHMRGRQICQRKGQKAGRETNKDKAADRQGTLTEGELLDQTSEHQGKHARRLNKRENDTSKESRPRSQGTKTARFKDPPCAHRKCSLHERYV